ncbi:hypothetical protein TNIN_496971 [Trichonephila inaurata madagascariensis]|uniref:Uncharacterized protein n=1 Tax=Trichonephila inaurata madagascariensis TaxID=2747483 RepID=A0A8X6X4C8_9ARAC|nr:hypothetical protein TNIN_496971 [Trichonephila inaurata madagascariensis]
MDAGNAMTRRDKRFRCKTGNIPFTVRRPYRKKGRLKRAEDPYDGRATCIYLGHQPNVSRRNHHRTGFSDQLLRASSSARAFGLGNVAWQDSFYNTMSNSLWRLLGSTGSRLQAGGSSGDIYGGSGMNIPDTFAQFLIVHSRVHG